MGQQHLKIAIIGDYNFTYNSHQATNLSIDHASRFLDVELSYYWIKINEAAQHKLSYYDQFDGIWIAPGPFQNSFFLNGVIRSLMTTGTPVLLTGESLRNFIEVLINVYQLNAQGEKLISDNLIEGNHFERIALIPQSKQFVELYENHSTVELASSRYSLYPQLISALQTTYVDIEAYNQFDEPEILSLKNHPFFVVCSFCPQVSSTREIPHPLINTFVHTAMLFASKQLK
jgi:CTP synthase (UTP-ammonia lyase)